MSTVIERQRPAVAEIADGGIPARRAVIRWAWRLFRREWRQQLLVLALLMLAVAATIWGAGVATNTPPSNPSASTFGTASALVTLPGGDPRLAADIATITKKYGPVDVIENQDISTGLSEAVMRLIHTACKRGVAAVVVTHDAQLASWADRVDFLRDGLVTDRTAPLPGPESLLSGEQNR